MTNHAQIASRMPADPALRDLLTEQAVALAPPPPWLQQALAAAEVAAAIDYIGSRAGRVLDRGDLYQISDVDGGGPEVVEAATGVTYVVDAQFTYEVVVTPLQRTECYLCREAMAVEVYRQLPLCRACSHDERESRGELVTVYGPCLRGNHAGCVGAHPDEDARPLDLARRCACSCHSDGRVETPTVRGEGAAC